MSNSLKELAQEYRHSIELLSSCIPDIRVEYRQATREGNKEKMKALAKKLAVVYEEIRDMRIVAETLVHYYDDSDFEEQLSEAS